MGHLAVTLGIRSQTGFLLNRKVIIQSPYLHCLDQADLDHFWTSTATWERTWLLPDPPKFLEFEGELPEPMVHSLHLLGGSNVLLIAYMDHGVM